MSLVILRSLTFGIRCITYVIFISKTRLKISEDDTIPKMVRKVVMNPDLSKASGPDFIPVVVLKNCEPELSYLLAELLFS